MTARLANFEIHASDPDVSVAFYTAALGWTFKPMTFGEVRYWQIVTSDGMPSGRLIKRHGDGPQAGAAVMGAVITALVDDIDAACANTSEAGGVPAMEKFPIPGEGWQAYFLDPDHNVFGLFQADPGAGS
ncbi:VOC family protein [Maricaulis maris]|jgi:uncharacterized protein|uniref:VOC family protein n=1 Tax=Maricaulis maris TaxID=74318 RepID=UPI00063F3CC0|nr:glyoxalase [Maricaulis maris]